MQYKNGREAKIGDVVRGQGHNFKHEIVGVLVGIAELGPEVAEGRIACVGVLPDENTCPMAAEVTVTKDGRWLYAKEPRVRVEARIDYARIDSLVALSKVDGAVLEPEEVPA